MTSTTAAEAAAEIRRALKAELGLNSKDVSVRASSYANGSSIYVRLKTERAILASERVREIATQKERVRRCEASGEILSGGNRYVDVSVDGAIVQAVELRVAPAVSRAIEEARGKRGTFVRVEGTEAQIAMVEDGSLRVTTTSLNEASCQYSGGLNTAVLYVAYITLGVGLYR